MPAFFSELQDTGLIQVCGADAGAFLQAQLTSDVAALGSTRTQYSGYCSPKGRLLATFLVWRCEDEFLLQLPEVLRETVQARLSRYVLRARVTLARSERRLFGIWGPGASAVLAPLAQRLPQDDHDGGLAQGGCISRIPRERYLVAARPEHVDRMRSLLRAAAAEQDEAAWSALDIAAGVPVITPETQEQYLPQMVNLDLIGGVSYSKGCYPGQEIVARTHYLGRVKQRMYRVHVSGTGVRTGDLLYSDAFGPEQPSGALLNVAPAGGAGHDALAVLQTSAVADVRWKSLEGPRVKLEALPYPV